MNQDQNGNAPQQQPTQPVQPQAAPQQAAQPLAPQVDVSNIPAADQLPQPPAKTLEIKFEDDLIMTVTSDTVNDMRFLDLYGQVSEDMTQISKLLRFMFGSEKYESIFAYYERKGQKFTITKMGEVFEKLDADLNSNPDFLRQ